MPGRTHRSVLGVMVLVIASVARAEDPSDLALIGATVIVAPFEDPIVDGVVLVRGETIFAVGQRGRIGVPEGAETIDCDGYMIVAGFWNSHVHFFERKWADAAAAPSSDLNRQIEEMLTRFGFTSVFDLGSDWTNTRHLRDRIAIGDVQGPSIRSTGPPLIAPGAAPSRTVLNLMGAMPVAMPEAANAEQAAAAAERLLTAGVDGIKLHLQRPPAPDTALSEEVMRAVATQAHARGMPVFVHPTDGADIVAAIKAGVDVIGHTTPFTGAWNETVAAAVRTRPVALTPTLTLWSEFARHDRVSVQDEVEATAVEQLRQWIDAGGTVLYGSDLGVGTSNPIGEYLLMTSAGMSFDQILDALTSAPARFFGEEDRRGRVAAGLQADLVICGGDPSVGVQALADVRYTLRAGEVIYQARAD